MNLEKQKAIRAIYLIFFLFGVSATIISPLIPWFSDTLSIGFDKIGIIISIGPFFGIISVLTAGRICDIWNIKKIILIGLIIIMSGFLLFGIYLTIITLILSLIFLRFGYGVIDTSGYAYAFQLLKGGHSTIFMRMELFYWFGAILSPILIGGILYMNLNPKYVFLFFSFVYLLAIFLFYIAGSGKSETKYKKDKDVEQVKLEISSRLFFFKDPVIIVAALMLFFYIGSMAGLSSWLTTYFMAFDLAIYQGSLILSFYWAFLTLGLFLAQKIIKKTNEITIILIGNLFGVISILIFGLIDVISVKIIFLALNGLFISGTSSMTMSISVSQNPKRAGTIVGFVIAVVYLGEIIFQPLLGFFAEYAGKKSIIYIIIAGFIISLILSFVLYKILKKKHNTELILFPGSG